MHTSDFTTEATTAPAAVTSARPLRRPVHERMLTGVASGIAEYLGVDTTLVRIGFVIMTILGGSGIALYLAGLLLIPEEGSHQSLAASLLQSLRSR